MRCVRDVLSAQYRCICPEISTTPCVFVRRSIFESDNLPGGGTHAKSINACGDGALSHANSVFARNRCFFSPNEYLKQTRIRVIPSDCVTARNRRHYGARAPIDFSDIDHYTIVLHKL